MEWLFSKLLATPVIGAILSPIINGLLTAQKQKLDAAGSHEARIVELTQQQIELDKKQAELNANIVIAEQGNWFTRSVRPTLAWVVIILLAKIFLYDKAFGQWTHGTTDSLDSNLWWIIQTIIISYFGGRSLEKISDKISGIFKK